MLDSGPKTEYIDSIIVTLVEGWRNMKHIVLWCLSIILFLFILQKLPATKRV